MERRVRWRRQVLVAVDAGDDCVLVDVVEVAVDPTLIALDDAVFVVEEEASVDVE